MISTTKSRLAKRRLLHIDPEKELVENLILRSLESGMFTDAADVVNFYVAFKSKTLILIEGPADSGKLDFIRFFAQTLIGEDNHQCQLMVGHPYWASGSENVALFTEAQTRYNTEKVLTLIEEAWQPENRWKVFIACLARISPAEIDGFFSSTAFQLGHGQIMSLPYAHFMTPIPFPSNLFIVGTIDSPWVHSMDEDLLTKIAIINWLNLPNRSIGIAPNGSDGRSYEKLFLKFSIRSEYSARSKLRKIFGWGMKGLEPLHLIEDILNGHGIQIPLRTRGQALIYLANAWTKEQTGLFHPFHTENLITALDLVISQTLLPNFTRIIKADRGIRHQISTGLGGQFPRTSIYLNERLSDDTVSQERFTGSLRDLVCGMRVNPMRASGKSEYQGQEYYFCSEGCKQAFDKDPQKYIH